MDTLAAVTSMHASEQLEEWPYTQKIALLDFLGRTRRNSAAQVLRSSQPGGVNACKGN
jgi:hypothetical protein